MARVADHLLPGLRRCRYQGFSPMSCISSWRPSFPWLWGGGAAGRRSRGRHLEERGCSPIAWVKISFTGAPCASNVVEEADRSPEVEVL